MGTVRDFSNLQIVSGLDFSSQMKSESLCVTALTRDFPEECNQIENKLRILFINEGGADSVTDTQIGRNHPEYRESGPLLHPGNGGRGEYYSDHIEECCIYIFYVGSHI